MRVCWVLTDLSGGGAERLPLRLAPALTRAALEIVLLKDRVEHDVPSGVTVRTLGPARRSLASGAPRLVAGLRHAARGADLVVGGLELDATCFAVACAALARRPVVAVVHTDLERTYAHFRLPGAQWWVYGRALAACRRVVAVSPEALAAARRLGVPDERLVEIPNPAPPAPLAARSPRVAGQPFRLLAVGRLVPEKAHDLLLDALARVADRSISLTLLGDGPLRAALEGQAASLGLGGRVRFAGFVRDPAPEMARAHAWVLTSPAEGLPLALLEAMQAGLPILSTRCGRAVEGLLEGEPTAGVLVDAGAAAALAAAIDALAADEPRAAALGAAGRERVRPFTPDALAPRWEQVFEEAVR